MKPTLMVAATAALLFVAGAASATELYYSAQLKGADASHKAQMKAVLDTDSRALDVTVTGYDGPATKAGFAGSGEGKAGLSVPIGGGSPAHATVKLTADQINALNAGGVSFFVDTKAGPGELRGKVSRASGVL